MSEVCYRGRHSLHPSILKSWHVNTAEKTRNSWWVEPGLAGVRSHNKAELHIDPLLNSQGGQLALHQTHPGTKGKLQIVVVRAATRGSTQRDSGCLWLALITDRQTPQALETPVGTKKMQNWLRQKNTD
ncbi:hypothetical protein PAMP_020057 [Pampus punctatissimus]